MLERIADPSLGSSPDKALPARHMHSASVRPSQLQQQLQVHVPPEMQRSMASWAEPDGMGQASLPDLGYAAETRASQLEPLQAQLTMQAAPVSSPPEHKLQPGGTAPPTPLQMHFQSTLGHRPDPTASPWLLELVRMAAGSNVALHACLQSTSQRQCCATPSCAVSYAG